VSGRRIEVEAAMPRDFRGRLERLRGRRPLKIDD